MAGKTTTPDGGGSLPSTSTSPAVSSAPDNSQAAVDAQNTEAGGADGKGGGSSENDLNQHWVQDPRRSPGEGRDDNRNDWPQGLKASGGYTVPTDQLTNIAKALDDDLKTLTPYIEDAIRAGGMPGANLGSSDAADQYTAQSGTTQQVFTDLLNQIKAAHTSISTQLGVAGGTYTQAGVDSTVPTNPGDLTV